MKRLSLYFFLVLIFSLFTSHSFSEKYSISNPEKFQDEKRKGYHCNLSNNINEKSCSGCENYSTRTICCYDEDGNEIWKNPQYNNSGKRVSGQVKKNNNIDTDWYLSSAWGIKHKRGIEKKYKYGKSLGVCVKKDGTGFYYTAVKSWHTGKGKKQSWLNITSVIGQRAWIGVKENIYGTSNKDFPISIEEIKKFQLAYDYNFKSKGTYNNNITFWLRHPDDVKPFIEIMLKFDATARKHKKIRFKNLKTNNYEFIVWSNKGQESKRKIEGLEYFFSIDSFERNTKINKDGNYSIDINLKQVFDYLVERKLVKNTDIVPGIEVTTEIWDGIGEMKIKKLKYEIVKE